MCRLILIFFFVCVIAAAILLAYAPWYLSLGVLIGGPIVFMLFLRIFAGPMIKGAMLMPFKAKSAVLRGATLDVHEVLVAPLPVREGEPDSESGKSLQGYSIEVTVKPAGSAPPGGFQLWSPGELLLAEKPASADNLPENALGVEQVEVQQDGAFVKDEEMKYGGPQRIRFTAGVNREWKKAYLYYYFEQLGEIELPK